MDIRFNSVEELYYRVFPALRSKVRELRKNQIDYIKEVDIWNCLVDIKWKNNSGLELSDVVDDILNTDNNVLDEYIKEKIKKIETEANMDVEIV